MSDTKLTKEQIECAANWWADAVTRPKFDNGDSGIAGALATILAMQSSKPVDDSGRAKFVAALSAQLMHMNEHDTLDVDYAPCRELSDAMTLAGVDRHNAPWKTIMWFSNGGVQVRHGYGAPEVELLLKSAA